MISNRPGPVEDFTDEEALILKDFIDRCAEIDSKTMTADGFKMLEEKFGTQIALNARAMAYLVQFGHADMLKKEPKFRAAAVLLKEKIEKALR